MNVRRSIFCILCVLGLSIGSVASAVELPFTLNMSGSDIVTLSMGVYETDPSSWASDSSTMSGSVSAIVDFTEAGGVCTVTSLNILSANIVADEDMAFSLMGYPMAINDVAGTLEGNGSVTGGDYAGLNYMLTLNQGTIEGAGQYIDLSTAPYTGTISDGAISVTSLGGGLYQASLAAPLDQSQPVMDLGGTIIAAGIAGTVNAVGVSAIPEPGTIAMLLGLGASLAGYCLYNRRRN